MSDSKITIRGARVHNLKNIDLSIPHNNLVVVTGLSGSGKSTLAFDTIFAEGQRRYVESLSAYARQFLGRVSKPDVDLIEGIAPAIAIEQKVTSRNPRSTVGTTTEIYDYMKLLFARIGRTYSPSTGREVRCYEVDDIVDIVLRMEDDSRVIIAAPLLLKQSEGIIERMLTLMEEGVNRVSYRGEVMLVEQFMPQVSDDMALEDVMVVVDRLKVSHDQDTVSRLADSVARAMGYGAGTMHLITDKVESFSSRYDEAGMTFERPTEHLFSFNNPIGACTECEGYGRVVGIDEALVIPDKSTGNLLQCLTQNSHMIITDFSNNCHFGNTHGVGGIQASTQSGLKYHSITALFFKIQQRHHKAIIKHRRGHTKILLQQHGPYPFRIFNRYHFSIDTNSLPKIN